MRDSMSKLQSVLELAVWAIWFIFTYVFLVALSTSCAPATAYLDLGYHHAMILNRVQMIEAGETAYYLSFEWYEADIYQHRTLRVSARDWIISKRGGVCVKEYPDGSVHIEHCDV